MKTYLELEAEVEALKAENGRLKAEAKSVSDFVNTRDRNIAMTAVEQTKDLNKQIVVLERALELAREEICFACSSCGIGDCEANNEKIFIEQATAEIAAQSQSRIGGKTND